MRALIGACLVAFSCANAYAQASVQGLTQQQLQDVRRAAEAQFQALEQQCYLRFAVNDCLHEALNSRRLVLDDLRRKEVELNNEERRKKAADQLLLIAEKTAKQQLEIEEASRKEALQLQVEAATPIPPIAIKPSLATSPAPTAAPSAPLELVPRPAENAVKNRADFDLKFKEAQDHKASRSKSRLEKKAGKPAQPLPEK